MASIASRFCDSCESHLVDKQFLVAFVCGGNVHRHAVALVFAVALGSSVLTTLPAGAAESLFVDSASYGVKCDGLTDDTAAINNAISAAPSDSVVTLPASSAPCLTSGTILLPNTKRINLLGGGAHIQYSGPGNAIGVLDMELGNVNPAPWAKGLSITCTNNAGYGIHIRNSVNIVIEDVQIYACLIGVYLHNTNAVSGGGYTEQTVLRNLDIYNCGYGIYLDPDTGQNSFANTTFENVRVDTMFNSPLSTSYGIYVRAGASPYRSTFVGVQIFPDKSGAVGLYTAGYMSGDFGNINFEVVSHIVNGQPVMPTNVYGITLASTFSTAGLNLQSHFAGFSSANNNHAVNAIAPVPAGWSMICGIVGPQSCP